MSRRDGKMYVAKRIFFDAELTNGLTVQVADETTAGCMWVFWTKTAARKLYGRNVELAEIRLDQQDDER